MPNGQPRRSSTPRAPRALRLSRAHAAARGTRANGRLVPRRRARACRSLTRLGPPKSRGPCLVGAILAPVALDALRRRFRSDPRRLALRAGHRFVRRRPGSLPVSSMATCPARGRASCGRSCSRPSRAWPTRSTACSPESCCSTCSCSRPLALVAAYGLAVRIGGRLAGRLDACPLGAGAVVAARARAGFLRPDSCATACCRSSSA